ncbi:AI-2E family transporter [Butyrivibrio sp. VCB2001]|uniref:AI-2E family transporter n=1 Tax=Butyrivibrio sp. VCB2001 TaxID=1280667 RepID=UPI0004082CEE|nr:AI-2E family transporter [Butyrivibrio sp. VCB2001]
MKNKPNQNQITWGITIFFVAVGTLLAYYVIFHGKTVVSTLNSMLDSISGVIMGVVLAYILIPMLNGIERTILIPIYKKRGIDVSFSKDADWKKRKQMRGIAVLITIAVFILLIYTLLIIIIPQLVSSIREIINNLPEYIKKIDDYSNSLLENNPDLQELIDSQLDSYYATLSVFITRNIKPYLPEWQTVLKVASKSVMSGVSAIINIIVGVIVAIYVLNSKERFTTRGKKIAYSFFKENVANELISAFRFTHRTFESFIGGKIVDSIIIGIICYIGCKILKIDYPVLISVIVGVTNVIPFFGPYIGGGAGALLLILIDPIQALIFLIFVIVLQQFDGNILGPYILGGSTGLSSFWVIFSIMFFGGLWGIVGWLIGVPIFAVFYAFVARITNHYLRKKDLSTNTSDYYDLAYIENGEYKLLSDQSNTKYNAGSKKVSSIKKIFNRKKNPKK